MVWNYLILNESKHGGSLRGFAKLKNSNIKKDDSINNLVKLEHELGINNTKRF